MLLEDHKILELPDDFVVEEAVYQFGHSLITIGATQQPNTEVVVTYDRDMLIEIGAMIVRCVGNKRQEDAA